MGCKYLHCNKCDGLFICADTTLPANVVCMNGKCEIEEVTEEDALRIAEEKSGQNKDKDEQH